MCPSSERTGQVVVARRGRLKPTRDRPTTCLILLTRRRVREFHASLWLDGLVAALGMAACAAALVLPPILAMSVQGNLAAVVVNLA